jgi:GTP-binding protein EngB required for normal cell division
MAPLNVVLVGESGAGKSTLINAVFGDVVGARTGVGGAQTMTFEPFGPTDTVTDLRVWDSRGFELRKEHLEMDFQRWVDARTSVPPDDPDRLHVAWYVVPATRARWTAADAEFVRGVLRGVATVVVLHKVDGVQLHVAEALEATIAAEDLPNVRAIVRVCSIAPLAPDTCPSCGSADVVVEQMARRWTCAACAAAGVSERYGHAELLRATRSAALISDVSSSNDYDTLSSAGMLRMRVPGAPGDVDGDLVVDDGHGAPGHVCGCFRADHSICWWFWCCCCCLIFK